MKHGVLGGLNSTEYPTYAFYMENVSNIVASFPRFCDWCLYSIGYQLSQCCLTCSDIRGVAVAGVEGEPVNVTELVAEAIGAGFAAWLLEKKKADGSRRFRVSIGHDSRISAKKLQVFLLHLFGFNNSFLKLLILSVKIWPFKTWVVNVPVLLLSFLFFLFEISSLIFLTSRDTFLNSVLYKLLCGANHQSSLLFIIAYLIISNWKVFL